VKTMSNKRFWLGILVIILVFGMMVVGCDDDPPNDNDPSDLDEMSDLDGIWISNQAAFSGQYFRFAASGGILYQSMASSQTATTWNDVMKATYPKNAKSPIICTITEVNTIMFGEGDAWKTWANLTSTQKGYLGGSQTTTIIISDNQFTTNGLTYTRQ